MLIYIAAAVQFCTILYLTYTVDKQSRKLGKCIQEEGEISSLHVKLLREHNTLRNASASLVTAYEDLELNYKEVQSNYTTVENASVLQTNLIEEQYDMIQSYDIKLTALQEKFTNLKKLRIN